MTQAERNMYGCTPCPKCGGKHRWPQASSKTIICDDCGARWRYVTDGSHFDEDPNARAD